MIRAGAFCLTLLAALPAQAQDQPDPRPPTRPAADITPQVSVPAPDAPQPFGPPAPPLWFTLAGTVQAHDACRLALSVMGARFVPVPPISDPDTRDCGIARPVRVSHILPAVELTGHPVMRCEVAQALALWTRDFVLPAAALMPDQPRLTAVQTGPAYQCRDRVGTDDAEPKPSEHGFGNAIDVMGFGFEGAGVRLVQPRQGDGDADESFQAAVRGTACLMFTTVLGPGSNAAHDDHLHLDLAARRGGWRLCE